MRVIKFQAWEVHFNGRIVGFHKLDFDWLSKFVSMPLLISTLMFGTAILLGVPLNAGTTFTPTFLFKILREPIRTFPHSMISFAIIGITWEIR
ncbi:ABC transporter C family member 14 [Spatholobus suberectus]|nr:ABC transporter C family member 14 [Spatholobus suberectus]